MHYFHLLFLSFMFSSGVLGQDSLQYENFAGSLNLIYEQRVFQNEVLGGAVNNLESSVLGQPLTYIGIGITTIFHVNRKRTYPGSIRFFHVIPQRVSFYDSISGRVSGFDFSFTLVGRNVFREKQWIDLVLGSGFKTGRVRLYGHSSLEQVNAYFSPFVSITPRFNIGKVSIQFRAEYELDITRSRWRKVWFSSSPKVDLGPMKSTGLSTSISVGRIF